MTDPTLREAATIRADIAKAHATIRDAKERYVKAKLKARSKRRAADAELLFADLAEYEDRQSIIEAYGRALISHTEHERLLALRDARENYAKDGRQYRDRVTEMPDKAAARIGDEYQDFLLEADLSARENERNRQGRFPRGD